MEVLSMLSFFIVAGSMALLLLCAWLILLILMQKPSANAGMGAALGGGAAESAFGGEASNVLTRWTVCGVVGFFVLTLLLSLSQIYRHHHGESKKELAPMAEEVVEAPKSLTELPTNTDPSKAEAAKKAEDENPKAEAAKAGTLKVETAKPKAAPEKAGSLKSKKEEGSSKKVFTASKGDVPEGTDKADASKKPSKSKISYRSDTKKNAGGKSASSGKVGSKNTEAKKAVAQ